jgi:hypothetical protein
VPSDYPEATEGHDSATWTHGPPPPGGRERRDALDSSLDCDVIARRPALGHGEASAQAFGVLWRPTVALELFGRASCPQVS